MKAAVFRTYGPPEVIHIEDVEKPVPKDDEVLIKVRAAGANPLDWHAIRGRPYIMRVMGGALRKPKATRLGFDVAGQVEAVGGNVTQFKPGDEVFGGSLTLGAYAEYACAPESVFVVKPDNLTFEQAASAPVAAFSALQGLRDRGQLQPGQKVLVNGAAGGVGTVAVQIAKSLGAEVTGVCGSRNVDLVRSLGADHVIDYSEEDFTRSAQRYDLVLDCVGNHSLSALRRALNSKGTCAVIAGPDGWLLGPLSRFVAALAMSRFVSQKMIPVIARPNNEDLAVISDLMATGKVKPVIDRVYELNDVSEAIRYVEAGHARGKVVITMN